MNNEDTIIMQPKNNVEAKQTQSAETPKDEIKPANEHKVAATVAAATAGGILGGAGTAMAANMQQDAQAEEAEVKVEETPTATAKPEPQEEPKVEPETEEIPVTVDEDGELDYTNNNGANPVTQNPQAVPASNDGGGESNEVQVLGVYQNEDGQELAVLTDGHEVAAVLDANGNGEADELWVDANGNQQIDEGEVYDVSADHVQMSQYENAYIAQQQEQMQQEQMQQEIFAYNADDQQDYNNDAPDLSFA